MDMRMVGSRRSWRTALKLLLCLPIFAVVGVAARRPRAALDPKLLPWATGILTILVTAIAGIALLALVQRGLIYHPGISVPSPTEAGLAGWTEVEIPSTDGLRLRAWHRPAKGDRMTVMAFHGNAGSLLEAAGWAPEWVDPETGLLLVSGRGYSGNPGAPSERGLLEDGRSAVAWLRAHGVSADQTGLLGWSLGTGTAVRLAAEGHGAALALLAPFDSVLDVANQVLPLLPRPVLRTILLDPWESIAVAPQIKIPTRVIHGDQDGVIGIAHGERLFAALTATDKRFVRVPGGAHYPGDPAAQGEIRRLFRKGSDPRVRTDQ